MPKVVITAGPGEGKEYDLAQAAILGRLDSNDIAVHDKKASREHAKIYKQGTQYAIVDLNSSNGTFVNGEKITKRMLKSGDQIEIGMVQMVFEAPEEQKPKVVRKTLEEAFDSKKGSKPADAGPKAGEIVMRGHQPLQYNRIKPGNPLLGIDLDQLSDTGRAVVYLGLVAVFAALMYVAYILVAGG